MSSFVVAPKHIAYLSFCCDSLRVAVQWEGKIFTAKDPQKFGQNLLNSNVGNVATNYPTKLFSLPGAYEPPYSYEFNPDWHWDGSKCTPFQVFKAAECFGHQCNGINEWEGSVCHGFMTALKHLCVEITGQFSEDDFKKTKEYDRAIWGAPDPDGEKR